MSSKSKSAMSVSVKSASSGMSVSKSKSAMSVSDVENVENTTLTSSDTTTLTTSDTSTLTSTLTSSLSTTLSSSITSSLTTTLTTTSALLTKAIQNTTLSTSTPLLESQDIEAVAASGTDDSSDSSMNMGYILGATSILAVASVIVYFITKKSKDKELIETYDCEVTTQPTQCLENPTYLTPSDCYYNEVDSRMDNEINYDLSTMTELYEQTPLYDLASE